MRYEGVNFFEAAASKMTYEEFERLHLGAFWQDRDEETRKKMLSEVYALIARPRKKSAKQ